MANFNCSGVIQLSGENIFDKIYPIGSVYIAIDETRPAEEISPAGIIGGEWEQLPENMTLWTCTSSAGEYVPAGLPNIYGHTPNNSVSCEWNYNDINFEYEFEGPFYAHSRLSGGVISTASKTKWSIGFDASRGNSIYGGSQTVQPPAIKVYAWKRVK